ncbi:lytic transglycosylase domain-containing protein [Catalinimonas niigatensis]|uniref:lytic transglycosylase domain-containing protein n=1 Tax=Catalinimonas niigatensis TaxID=1397264 RepID=UPI002665F62A|nr:lytic transglycosylase domain-containing protein [Catalinimonas niigatensis]WPP50128.1 transglycosylase SLT domain-containing protein [Catalinimonas niigatensis]
METKGKYYFLSLSIAFIFLSTCTDIEQRISSADIEEDSTDTTQLPTQESELSTIDAVMAIFSNAEPEDTQSDTEKFTAAYLDSTTGKLFLHPVYTFQNNPYGFEEDELVSYPDSVYQKRFANMTSEIPLVYNRHVENFIDLYAIRKKNLTERMFGKSMLYFPYIEKVLMEEELPHDLKYLTMVESALHPDAKSHMEAVGLWQIRYRTGKWLGLEINDFLDERMDPYQSTKAAVAYLKRLYTNYGSWPMALAAYNSGPGNVNRAIVRAGGSRDYWKIRKYLPVETQSYVPAFMAIIYINRYQQEHNIRPIVPDIPFQAVDTVRIYKEISFTKLADALEMSEESLAFLNPALTQWVIPSSRQGWPLVLPMDKMAIIEEKKPDLFSHRLQNEVASTAQVLKKRKEIVPEATDLKLLEHTVRRGQTMNGIAKRYGVDLSQIRDWNAMRDNTIRAGQVLKLYVPESEFARY